MRIGIFTDTYAPEINGVATSVVTLQNILEKHGHEVYVVTTKKGLIHSSREGNVFRMPGIELKWLYGYILSTPYHATVKAEVDKMNLDVIHVQQEFSIGMFGRYCAKQLEIPVVYTYHTMYEDYTNYVNKFNLESVENISKKAVMSLSKTLCQSSTIVVAPSEKTEEALRRYGVRRPIRVVPTGIDLNEYKKENVDKELIQKLKDEYNVPKNHRIISYLGRIAPEKDIDMAIEGFAKLKEDNVTMMVVGGGPSLSDLKKLAKVLQVENRIIFTDKQPRNHMPAFYAMADAFVSPSLSETQGLTFMEALAAGLPIFARKDEVLEELVYEDKTGYYFEDAQGFADKLENFLNFDESKVKKMNTACEEVVKKYDVEVFYESIMDTYESAIEIYSENYMIESIKSSDDCMKLYLTNQKTQEEETLLVSLDDYLIMDVKKGGILEKGYYEMAKAKEHELSEYRRCIRKLRGRDYTRKEVYDLLINAEDPLGIKQINEIIERLETQGYIDDNAYTVLQIDKMNRSLFGKKKIIQKLVAKGIPYEDIVSKMEAIDDDQELTKARALANKYKDTVRNKSLKDKKMHMEQKLHKDGFHGEIIREVMNELNFEDELLKESVTLKLQMDKAYKTYGKKYEGTKLREKVIAAMVRKGFSYEDIKYAIEMRNEYE